MRYSNECQEDTMYKKIRPGGRWIAQSVLLVLMDEDSGS